MVEHTKNKSFYDFFVRSLKNHKTILSIIKKIFPYRFRNILVNFTILASEYNQFGSMKKWSCIDKNGDPIPWYTYPTIEYLKNLDFSDKRIFEFGSGNSSLWWAKRCDNIISIESDEDWFRKIQILKSDMTRFDYRLESKEFNYVNQPDIAGSHVIIIDGVHRNECAKYVVSKIMSKDINPNILIFDNSDRYPATMAHLNEMLSRWIQVDFSGFGPINGYTWTTTLFINPDADAKLKYNSEISSVAGIKQRFD